MLGGAATVILFAILTTISVSLSMEVAVATTEAVATQHYQYQLNKFYYLTEVVCYIHENL